MRTKLPFLMLVGLLFSAATAQADLILNLTPAVQTGMPGTTLTFSGTLQNTGSTDLFLNADNVSLLGTDLLTDDTKFFTNVPPTLAGGASTTPLELFDVIIGPNAMPGDNMGSLTILGGADGGAQDILASQNFQVTVVPEPGMMGLLLGFGVSGIGFASCRRHRKARR